MTRVNKLVLLFIIGEILFPAQANNCGQVIIGFDNKTIKVGDTNVTLTCTPTMAHIPRNTIIWNQFLHGESLVQVFASVNPSPELFTFILGDLIIDNVTAHHHGGYRCELSLPCTNVVSSIGYITVLSPVEIEFVNLPNSVASKNVDQQLVIPFRLFGSPEPQLTLWKQTSSSSKRSVDGYSIVNDPRIIVSMTNITFESLAFSDEGSYKILSNNTEGEFSMSFTVDVTGVLDPDITLSETQFTPQSYGEQSATVTCTVPTNAFDTDSGDLTLTWRHSSDNSNVSYTNTLNVYQTKLNDTSTALNIQRVEDTDNGQYLCYAENSKTTDTESFSIKGPPASVSNLKSVLAEFELNKKQTILTWDPPNSYGANLKNYMIQFIQQDMNTTVTQDVSVGPQYSILGLCSNDPWTITVVAVNEFDGIGSPSSITVIITDSNCDSSESTTATTTVTTTQPIPTESITTTTTSISDGGTTSTTGTVVEPTAGSTSSASSVPIVAGAAAGAFVLFILIAILVFAVACYITINRRGSKPSRAKQQWRQNRYSNEHIDNGNGYIEATTITKSPDSQMNTYEVALPSPLPATPGYGPVYIDPHFEFPRENLEFTDILYDGAFTVIYKAKAVGIKENKPVDVAVKSLKEEFLDYDDYSSALVMEMEQLAQLEPHANIVGLVRVCSVTRPVLMVMEYMCHGDLLGFLRTTRGHTDMYTVNPGTKNLPTNLRLTSRDLLSIIKQVATGMKFLSEQKIVHGALCTRNVLVSTSMEVKIFNIGIHNLDNDETFESLVRWMAPEVFVDGNRTAYGDTWSFGILMWEVVTLGGTPYADLITDDLYTQLMSGVRLQKPPHCTQPVYDVMTMCWESIPQHRPMFFEIIDHLQNFNISKMSYLDLRNYNENAYSQFDESERQQTSIL